MKILDRIHYERTEIWNSTGIRPDLLYLGHEEMAQLVSSNQFSVFNPKHTYLGMEVIEVSRANHFHMAIRKRP